MTVKATRTANDYRVTLTARQHQFTADVEVASSGTDLAPNPHDYLAASLAACTSMTVQMYANRKQWPLQSCDVSVSISLEGDAKDPNSKTLFEVQVAFVAVDGSTLDADQKKRLIEIANHCPVHRELARPISIRLSEIVPA